MQTDEERYDIQGKLGEGGRGTVYLATDRQLNRTVAIKRLIAEKENADAAYEAVLRESRALSALSSPHIVRVFDVGQDEDGPYVVMEHLNGKTLHEVVSHAPLVEADFLQIAEQALEALIAAHEVHLLHRDIKPGNLMLNWLPSGRFNLKLLDFGLAKFSETPSVQTVAFGKSVMGSIYFMAPEQFERRPLDARTDLYSLGCVFFFSLTGDYPFDGDSVAAVMASHLQGKHPSLAELRPDLPSALCEWVSYFIAAEPDQRPQSAQAALESLHEVHRGTFTRKAPAPIGRHLTTGPTSPDPATGRTPLVNGMIRTATHPIPTATTGGIPTRTTGVVPLTTAQPTKPSTGLPGWLVAAIVFCVVSAVAFTLILLNRGKVEDTPQPEPEPPAEAVAPPAEIAPDQAFLRRDTDKDGKISLEEFFTSEEEAVRVAQQEIFHRLDVNEDDGLSPGEYAKR